MAYTLYRERFQQRFYDKQNKLDDIIIVCDEDVLKSSKLTFIDFVAAEKLVKSEDTFKPAIKRVKYCEIVEFANKWLLETECWDVISCESDALIVMDSNYKALTLRLWIKRFDTTSDANPKPIIPQIKCKDFLPKILNKNEFENMDSVLQCLNESINNEEINGKIINCQTVAITAEQDLEIDSDTPTVERWFGRFVFILRIFYISGPTHEEEVGLADFVPECLTGGNFFKEPKFEKQSALFERASKWLSENREIRFCNAQCIDLKLKSCKLDSLDTKEMSIHRKTGEFVRILRVVYTKPKNSSSETPLCSAQCPPPSSPPPSLPPVSIQREVFVLHGPSVIQDISDFLTRDEWTAAEPYKWFLLSCATIIVLSNNGLKASLEHNSNESFKAASAFKKYMNRDLHSAIILYYDIGSTGDHHMP